VACPAVQIVDQSFHQASVAGRRLSETPARTVIDSLLFVFTQQTRGAAVTTKIKPCLVFISAYCTIPARLLFKNVHHLSKIQETI